MQSSNAAKELVTETVAVPYAAASYATGSYQMAARADVVQSQYLEAEILSADPVKLVALLYRGALDAVSAARRHLKEGDIRERARRINQAYEILLELVNTLDHSAGGEMSRNLAELYVYMQAQLLAANSQQAEAPLAEVEKLLGTLIEGWKTVPVPETAANPDTPYEAISCSY